MLIEWWIGAAGCLVRVAVNWSSRRGTTGCSMRVADVSRVVDRCSWMFGAGSCHWSSRIGTAGSLMQVADVGRVVKVQLDDCCG